MADPLVDRSVEDVVVVEDERPSLATLANFFMAWILRIIIRLSLLITSILASIVAWKRKEINREMMMNEKTFGCFEAFDDIKRG